MTEPAKDAMTAADAVRLLTEWSERAEQDVADTPKGCDSRPGLEAYADDVKRVLTLMETHVLVPKASLPVVPAAYVQKTINVARENAAWSKEQGEFFDERGTIKGPSERLLWQSALYTFWADALVAVLKEYHMTEPMLVYLRCGDLPDSGTSRNYLTGEMEPGVSVYEGVLRGDHAQVILPEATASACVSLSGCIDRPVYQVTGELAGYGSDGEPLLRHCRIVRRVELYRRTPLGER